MYANHVKTCFQPIKPKCQKMKWTLILLLSAAPLLAVDLTTTNRNTLAPFYARAGHQPVTVVSFGDSMADSYRSIPFAIMNSLVGRFGLAGCSMNNWGNNLLINLTNGASYVGPDGFWFSGSIQVPEGGSVWWSKQWASGIFSDTLGLFYVAQSNGGAFTVSVATDGGSWVNAFTVNSYSATPVGCYTNLVLDPAIYMLRVDGISGTNVVLGARAVNSKSTGVEVSFLDFGGISLGDVTNVPLSIREPILKALAPDLLIWHMKEGGGDDTHQRLIDCEGWFAASGPGCSVLYIGTPYEYIDTNSTFTADQNAIVRSVAVQFNRAYLDCMTPSVGYPWLLAHGFMDDGVHPSRAGNAYLEAFTWEPHELTLQAAGGGISVSYSTFSNIVYTVEGSRDFTHWNAVSTNSGDGTVFTQAFPAAPGGMFRLRLDPGP